MVVLRTVELRRSGGSMHAMVPLTLHSQGSVSQPAQQTQSNWEVEPIWRVAVRYGQCWQRRPVQVPESGSEQDPPCSEYELSGHGRGSVSPRSV